MRLLLHVTLKRIVFNFSLLVAVELLIMPLLRKSVFYCMCMAYTASQFIPSYFRPLSYIAICRSRTQPPFDHPSLPADYPPLPTGLQPLINRISSLDPDFDYDWRKILSIALNIQSKQQQQPQPQDTARHLVASLYWLRGMKSLCLASLLKVDGLTEDVAANLIRHHFSACSQRGDGTVQVGDLLHGDIC